ncbi:hypothetical protein [Crossiella sp. CA198]|uniref:hypothetical protein n=1 Tax=Crossiella sp. CA198 TaxID=3455607 RepID=UPI003F8D2470
MLAYETATKMRADQIIPGEIVDTHCGIGYLAWALVLRVRVIENNNPNCEDRIEVTFEGDAISNTRVYLSSSLVDVIPIS